MTPIMYKIIISSLRWCFFFHTNLTWLRFPHDYRKWIENEKRKTKMKPYGLSNDIYVTTRYNSGPKMVKLFYKYLAAWPGCARIFFSFIQTSKNKLLSYLGQSLRNYARTYISTIYFNLYRFPIFRNLTTPKNHN